MLSEFSLGKGYLKSWINEITQSMDSKLQEKRIQNLVKQLIFGKWLVAK